MAEEQQLSKRDAWNSRVTSRPDFKDVDMNNEDARLDAYNGMMDQLEGYESNFEKVRNMIDESPMAAELILALQKQGKNFDATQFLDEQEMIDIEDYIVNADKQSALKAGSKAWKERRAQAEKIKEAREQNKPVSAQVVKQMQDELGLSDEQRDQAIEKMYQIMSDLVAHKIDADLFRLVTKGMTADDDIAQAREEGRAEGVNTRVTDTLRKLPNRRESVPGAQVPESQPVPKKKNRNPFIDE